MNLAAYSSRFQADITLLAYALHFSKINAVAYLVSRGAQLPPVQGWPMSRAIYDILRPNWIVLKGSHARVKVFKDMNNEDLAKF